MKAAVYWGCKIPTEQYGYEMSVRRVMPHFDIALHDIDETSCCGGPVRSVSDTAAVYLSIRNLALVAKRGLSHVFVPCNECHFMMSEAKTRFDQDDATRERIVGLLKEEDLEPPETIQIWHTVDLLHDFVGVETIRARVVRPLTGLTFAVHPGCQIIRPSEFSRPDAPETPRKLDDLVEALGAKTREYPEKLDCCGAALLYSHADSALSLSGLKLKAVQTSGVDGFVDTCPYCHTLFDSRQTEALATVGVKSSLSTFYYTQLLGLALGAKSDELGLHLNQTFNPEAVLSKPGSDPA